MADASYQPGVYRTQGGNELVIKSSGTLTMEGTSTSTGTVAIGPVAAATTTTTMPAGGLSIVTMGTTATGSNNYTIANPVIGQSKYITATGVTNTSDGPAIVGATTTVTFGTTAFPRLKFAASGTVQLIGRTTLIYDYMPSNSTTLVFATTAA